MAQQRYSILEKLDSGGMAEVFKGKSASMRGFEKLVAIKRVLPTLSKNPQFISMFLDEARLSLHLNHANVVQTFDIGMADNAYFIVMEWVDGANLKSILETVQQHQLRLPREQAVYIAIEICKGLSHAHNRQDPEGRPLQIVHRDVSPPNVLLSREGEVKLVDFGLAKATSQMSTTDPGVVKGKFGYLSPEAAYGKSVDVRTDVFATGIVLWEMLAGQRLFQGETDRGTIEQVRAAQVPSLIGVVADLEPRLDAILKKALAREPRDRYQSAEALGHDLARYLFDHRLMVTSYDIALLIKRVLSLRNEQPSDSAMNSAMARINAEVQAEIGRFTSLEDLDKMEFVSVAQQGDSDPSAPMGFEGEDPRGWAEELGMDLGADEGDDLITSAPSTGEFTHDAALATGAKSPPLQVSDFDPSSAQPAPAPALALQPPAPSGGFTQRQAIAIGLGVGLGLVALGALSWFVFLR